mmetsp:Transcript_39977/g.62378  ORF Transcript_39977/g.62378 Transcript_39977/m.62378 type:complete len:99 (-) Transcript_39977:689-985(-)
MQTPVNIQKTEAWPIARMRDPKNWVMQNDPPQPRIVHIATAMLRYSEENSSPAISHGTGPHPNENAEMNRSSPITAAHGPTAASGPSAAIIAGFDKLV